MHLPMGSAVGGVVGFQPGDHFGNIGREYCSILAPLMDSGFRSLDDSALVSRYGIDRVQLEWQKLLSLSPLFPFVVCYVHDRLNEYL